MIEELQKDFSEVGINVRVTYFSADDQRMAGRFENDVLYLMIDHKEDVVPADVHK
jgi:hypothetical protein